VTQRAHALRAAYIVKARRVRVEAHIAVGGLDEHIVGAAGQLKISVGFELSRFLVVDHAIGAKDVVLVVNHHIAAQGQ
jgi:hypothetical protein